MRAHVVIAAFAMLLPIADAQAQPATFNERLMFDPNGLDSKSSRPSTLQPPASTTGQTVQQQPVAKPAAKPASQQTAAPAPKPATRTAAAPARRAPAGERVMNDATVAAQSRSTAGRPVPREEQNLGRVSLPQGSLGYEGKTSMQTYDMSDGRRVPGFENIQRNDSSYFGLSLRMPTAGSPASSSSSSFSSPSAFGSHGAN